MLMMLVLVEGYLVYISGRTDFASMDLVLAVFPMLPKPGWLQKIDVILKLRVHLLAPKLSLLVKDSLIWALQLDLRSLYVRQFAEQKVKGWSSDVTYLAKVAQSQPHTAYSGFT